MTFNTSSSIQTSRHTTDASLSVPELHRVCHRLVARGLYRRSGFAPCPEDIPHSVVSNSYYSGLCKNCNPQFGKQMFEKNIDLDFGIY